MGCSASAPHSHVAGALPLHEGVNKGATWSQGSQLGLKVQPCSSCPHGVGRWMAVVPEQELLRGPPTTPR